MKPIKRIKPNPALAMVYAKGPILIVDDDEEDLQLIQEAFKTLDTSNEMLLFQDVYLFMDYLRSTEKKPFFILCDVNMHQLDGFQLREKIYQDTQLRFKSIPFLFLSTSNSKPGINKAYSLSVQGYFKKPDSFEEMIAMLKRIIEYWDFSLHPNSLNLGV